MCHASSARAGKRIFLEFEGVNHVAEFWLNGERLTIHRGGYTGFEFDITPQARFGAQTNVLTVKADNLYHGSVPPTVKTDYTFYGGIYRDVWLRVTDRTCVDEVVWTTPSVSPTSAQVKLRLKIVNKVERPARLTVTQEILDPKGLVVPSVSAEASVPAGGSAELEQDPDPILNPRLWSPETPNLYRVRTSLREGSNALPDSRHVKDMELIREMGANFWRTSHYPHDPATIEASDRLGLLVWEELPINKEIGDPDEYIANVSNMVREMIRRDRNHPSIVLWGIAGEINAPISISRWVVETAVKLYRELDPARPVVMHAPRGEEIEALVDVVGLDAGKETDEKHARHPGRSYMIGEYSVSLMGRGIYGGGPESEELACERHEQLLRELNLRPWMAGGCIWRQFDYDGETYDAVIPHVVAFGMTDVWRIPKEVFYFYRSQWTGQPMVHIVGHWTWPGEEGRRRSVKVYSNADQVDLFLNGKSLGVKPRGKDPGLRHPPRVWEVPYEPGTLRAVATHGRQQLVDERRTAGRPHRIVLESDVKTLESGNLESLAYITAAVVDERGAVVPSAHDAITFTLYGPGELLEQTSLGHGTGLTWNSVAGKTRIALRATDRSGQAAVSAFSPGLRMGRITLEVTAPGKPNEMDYKEFH